MRIRSVEADPDPLPRAAPVGPGSAYAAVAAAPVIEPAEVVVTGGGAAVAHRSATQLGTWRFSPDERDWRLVAVPHCWSRAEADLADHKGPSTYEHRLGPGDGHRQLRLLADYVAVVTLDGTALGGHEGGFTPAAFDLPADGGLLRVRVDDPLEKDLQGPDPVVARKRKIKGVTEFHDSRPGGFSAGSWFPSWAATRYGSGGLVEVPQVVTTGVVRLDATFVTAADGRVAINWVLTNLGEADVDVTLVADIGGDGLRITATLPPGAARVGAVATVDDLAAWRPGAGAVHRAVTEVRVDGRTSDAGAVTFGARRVDMDVAGPDRYQLYVDGRRTYVRAANHIPGVWAPELTEELLRTDLRLATRANLNSLGLHAQVLPRRFYDAADEHGMLVYQDFPLNLAHDPDGAPLFDGGPTMAEASMLLAAEMVYDLYNHPSVVYWCGHNEPAYQLAEAFGAADHPDVVRAQRLFADAPNEEELDTRRAQLWADIDPTRPAYKASGLGRLRDEGDVHGYSGSLSADPTTTTADVEAHFQSEFGAWTPMFCAAATAVGARGDWPPPLETAADWEHRTLLWWSAALHAGRPERYPDYPSWAFGAQLWGGVYLKLGVEGLRRRMWAPSGGHRSHLLLNHWGDAGGGVIDRHRTVQAHYWALADANRPLLPVVEPLPSMRAVPGEPLSLRTWVVNDTPRSGPTPLRWTVARLAAEQAWVIGADEPAVAHAFGEPHPAPGDLVVVPRGTGEQVASGSVAVDLAPFASTASGSIDFTPAERAVYRIDLEVDGVRNWGAFVAAPADWLPQPGCAPAPRVRLEIARPGPFRLVRRWTGQTVAVGPGPAVLNDVVPDQYLLDGMPVDLYGDVVVDADGRASAGSAVPWAFHPGG